MRVEVLGTRHLEPVPFHASEKYFHTIFLEIELLGQPKI